jgi:hypothetical protein
LIVSGIFRTARAKSPGGVTPLIGVKNSRLFEPEPAEGEFLEFSGQFLKSRKETIAGILTTTTEIFFTV